MSLSTIYNIINTMPKKKTIYVCSVCGREEISWCGVCPSCGSYSSFEEQTVISDKKTTKKKEIAESISVLPGKINFDEQRRFSTDIKEVDRVLGGGIVKGSLVLFAGEPGIGKSTILLQIANNVARRKKTLYVSGEESVSQIMLRAKRLFQDLSDIYMLSSNNLQEITDEIGILKPEFVIADSIQTISSDDISAIQGSVSQIKEVTSRLMDIGKKNNISIFIVGHVTKDGNIAGPKILEHLVDTVVYFEGERYQTYRMLRAVKNRFGSTNELGIFEMSDKGLIEILNPSGALLEEKPKNASGSVISVTMEGSRPIMVEIQALISTSNFAVPRRSATGLDYNRANMLLAVIEKKLGFKMQTQDVYVNLTGGLQVNEPAVDLAIISAVVSGYKNKVVSDDTVILGEVGLAGEIRSVTNIEKRVKETVKLGFKKIIVPYFQLKELKKITCEIIGVSDVSQAISLIIK